MGVEKCGATNCIGDGAITLLNLWGLVYRYGRWARYSNPSNTPDVEQLYNEKSQISTGFKLDQNYPNPFDSNTTIQYSIPPNSASGFNLSNVQLKVYDILGREVATLVNEKQKPGKYEVEFNSHSGSAWNLSSGIFLSIKCR